MKKRTKNRIADVREKRARFAKRFSANGPFRTAAILPFLGGLFLYKAYACLGEAQPRRLVQDKHTPKCQRGLNIEINCVVFEGLYNYKIIQMIDNLCKMCVL